MWTRCKNALNLSREVVKGLKSGHPALYDLGNKPSKAKSLRADTARDSKLSPKQLRNTPAYKKDRKARPRSEHGHFLEEHEDST